MDTFSIAKIHVKTPAATNRYGHLRCRSRHGNHIGHRLGRKQATPYPQHRHTCAEVFENPFHIRAHIF